MALVSSREGVWASGADPILAGDSDLEKRLKESPHELWADGKQNYGQGSEPKTGYLSQEVPEPLNLFLSRKQMMLMAFSHL